MANESMLLKCIVGVQEMLFKKRELCGGTIMMAGMVERFQKELGKIACHVEIKAQCDRKHIAWIGNSVHPSLSAFQQMRACKQEYEEHGISVVTKIKVSHIG